MEFFCFVLVIYMFKKYYMFSVKNWENIREFKDVDIYLKSYYF